ncbi:hypothetical protein Pth03_53370 [Planotetraspora thailandica]|uniref:PadR family transcriptional regulator n=1 Tax=Planotetraspora thailandica TaxID=487172 RepID=A0A8J3V580_9ACTN|nr:PadR family transcriptional regulator [Planotetraspora thailandica]GII56948.1 hypothetical protein Pth03_53370 [Planotetraspora thailandica]
MPLQHAVLALLDEGPSYGYELKANFEAAVGPEWGGLNIGHMYQILDRLARDELVSVSRTVVQENRPDRTVYEITPSGRTELQEWLDSPAIRTSGYRDEFILKILAAGQRGSDAVRTVCRVQREARMAELATLRLLRREHADEPLASLTIEAAILHTQADLKLIDAADERADSPLLALEITQARRDGARVDRQVADAATGTDGPAARGAAKAVGRGRPRAGGRPPRPQR